MAHSIFKQKVNHCINVFITKAAYISYISTLILYINIFAAVKVYLPENLVL